LNVICYVFYIPNEADLVIFMVMIKFSKSLFNKLYCFTIVLLLIISCQDKQASISKDKIEPSISDTSIVLLGTIQDGGSPHIGCKKDCCKSLFDHPDPDRQVISLGLFDSSTKKKYLFDATPDITTQMKALKNFGVQSETELADGIFLTHAHIGHYTGLMYLGKEATNSKDILVYAMPRMKAFLENNGPWSQLVKLNNIDIKLLENETPVKLSTEIEVTSILVPHRDEYSETVGFRIKGPNKSALFIPDVDKWDKWDKNIIEEIKKVDYAFLDATFYSGEEISARDISGIPHPFVIESLERFKDLNEQERSKIIFIHFNHTNPLIDINSKEAKNVLQQGFRVGQIGDVFGL
jgi:pyrroloquinoline quinone biosynthesis protein B